MEEEFDKKTQEKAEKEFESFKTYKYDDTDFEKIFKNESKLKKLIKKGIFGDNAEYISSFLEMLKDFFLNEVKNGINKAIEGGKLGSMGLQDEYSLIIEKPKNADFGDFAVNVSSLARVARIAPMIIFWITLSTIKSIKIPWSINTVMDKSGFCSSKLSNLSNNLSVTSPVEYPVCFSKDKDILGLPFTMA